MRLAHGTALLLGSVAMVGAPLVLDAAPRVRADLDDHSRARDETRELVVYGATSAGVAAAVEAARSGTDVVLIDPDGHVGGMTTSGLGATDVGNRRAIGGIAREFYRRVRAHYDDDDAWARERREDFRGRGHRPGEDAAWTFEPKVAQRIVVEMLREAPVPLVEGERLDLQDGVERDGARIVRIRMESGRTFTARMFIDATYEGDLMSCAGVSYRIGREAGDQHGEDLNGVRTALAVHHQFTVDVDPYVEPGEPSSGLLPGIAAEGPGAEASGDRRIQAYCFRLCTTDVPESRRPWPEPPGYDAKRYELLLRNFEAGDHRVPWNPVWMPNRKTDTNNNFAISTDHIGANHGWPEGDHQERARIWQDHLRYTQGLMFTLANHPRVPADVRAHFQRLGLARDEFVETDNWPPQLYLREARRMIGTAVVTEQHCLGKQRAVDGVGLGSYGMDSHNVQRYVTSEGVVRNEGDVQVHGFAPFPISYGAIVPRRGECTNLLVPVCVSATHIAFGSIRMEPVFMALGQSAAVAAGLALRDDTAVQDVPHVELRRELLARGQVLDPPR